MTALEKRATKSQWRIMRAVSGAVKNAADAHPDWEIDRRFAGSIAKRAAGTLTAGWPDVLAARDVSSGKGGVLAVRETRPVVLLRAPKARRGGRQLAPLNRLHDYLGYLAGKAGREGNAERCEALRDALRAVAKVRKGERLRFD